MKNVNTQPHWDYKWKEEGRDTWRTYPTSFPKIIDLLKDGTSLLDIGCGNGVFLNSVKQNKKSMELMGLDISPIGIKQMKEFYGIDGVVSELPEIPINEERFDYITALDVLEHLTYEVETVKKCFSLLKPSGTFIALVPTTPPAGEHIRSYNEESLSNLLSRFTNNIKITKWMEEGDTRKETFGFGRGYLILGLGEKA